MMTTPAAPAAAAFSTLAWNVQVPRRISATEPRSNSSKSVVLQPLAEESGGPSASPTFTARNRAVTLVEPELVKVRKAAAGAGSCRPSGKRTSRTGGTRSSKNEVVTAYERLIERLHDLKPRFLVIGLERDHPLAL